MTKIVRITLHGQPIYADHTTLLFIHSIIAVIEIAIITGQLQDTTAIVKTKRDIARAKTALRSLELKAQA